MCTLRGRQPKHLNIRAVLRLSVPYKGLHPLRRYAAIPADLLSANGFNKPFADSKYDWKEHL